MTVFVSIDTRRKTVSRWSHTRDWRRGMLTGPKILTRTHSARIDDLDLGLDSFVVDEMRYVPGPETRIIA